MMITALMQKDFTRPDGEIAAGRKQARSFRPVRVEARIIHIAHMKHLGGLHGQLRETGQQGADERQKADLQKQIEALENTMLDAGPRPPVIEENLFMVSGVLRNPVHHISAGFQHLHLTHMGIKVDPLSRESAYALDIAEIRMASKEPRADALLRFPDGNYCRKRSSCHMRNRSFRLDGPGSLKQRNV